MEQATPHEPGFVLISWNEAEIINTLKSMTLPTEKVKYLKQVIESMNIERGINYYKDHNNRHRHPVPPVWHGVMSKRAGMNFHRFTGIDALAFEAGQEAYSQYCMFEYWIQLLEKGQPLPIKKPSANLKHMGIALLHHYWATFGKDKSKAITATNKKTWSDHYGKNEGELWKKVKELEECSYTPAPNHHSVKAFAEQYKLIIPMLSKVCEPAAREVEQALNLLKRKYPAYLPEK